MMEELSAPNRKGTVLLVVAAATSVAIALLHIVIVVAGPRAYRYFGAGDALVRQAEAGSWVPPLLALLVAALFVACAVYALAGAGRIRRLPWMRAMLLIVAAVLTLRGISAVPQAWVLVKSPGSIPTRYFVSSLVSLLTGLCYAVGIGLLWRRFGTPRRTAG
jgi:hypothetical protein